MELSWLMKLRIAASVATGVVVIGLLAWPLAALDEPFGVVLAGSIGFGGKLMLAGLAFVAGFTAFFLSWPYGREIGILAVPSGLTIWAVRSGNMAELMRMTTTDQYETTLAQHQALFASLKWEPIFWLTIVAAGFLGVLLAQRISQQQEISQLNSEPGKSQQKAKSKSKMYLNPIIALAGSLLIAQFCIRILAQDIRMFDSSLGSVVAQPAAGQIVFAVSLSFGIAAFIVKKLLNAGYIWPIIASAFVTGYCLITYVSQDVLQHLIQRWPPVFFSNAVASILPVQIVALGTLGAIAGYWMAVRYGYWRKHEMK